MFYSRQKLHKKGNNAYEVQQLDTIILQDRLKELVRKAQERLGKLYKLRINKC